MATTQTTAEKISTLLIQLGVPANLNGYRYICAAVLEYSGKMHSNVKITKDIYPSVAKKYDSTPQRVERSIRHAVGVAFERGDIKLIQSIFGYTVNANKGKPTNSEFIAILAYRVSENGKALRNH